MIFNACKRYRVHRKETNNTTAFLMLALGPAYIHAESILHIVILMKFFVFLRSAVSFLPSSLSIILSACQLSGLRNAYSLFFHFLLPCLALPLSFSLSRAFTLAVVPTGSDTSWNANATDMTSVFSAICFSWSISSHDHLILLLPMIVIIVSIIILVRKTFSCYSSLGRRWRRQIIQVGMAWWGVRWQMAIDFRQ